MSDLNWTELWTNSRAIRARFGDIWNLPLAKSYDFAISKYGTPGAAALELGAGDRRLKTKLEKMLGEVEYKSFDVDLNNPHDFARLDDVSGEYDLVFLLEVVEHVRPEIVTAMFRKAMDVLRPGGRIVVTTPNIYSPPSYLRCAEHVTHWCYDELGGVLQSTGFEVTDVARVYNDSVFKCVVRRFLFYPVFRIVGIDFSRQIVIVGKK
ncbi:MAG: methyltransferase domain-containing protein [Planctomycetes bacterium]|nr:methyltransferase domain-containing protein [Planctomycetota bacterium]